MELGNGERHMADAVKIIDQSGRQMQPLPTTKAEVPAPQNLLEVIARAASDPTVDIDKMDRLLQMREREETRAAEAEFNTAMTAAQTEMGRIKTNKENSQTHSRYADYASLDRALRPIYTKHGFALSFNTVEAPAEMVARRGLRLARRLHPHLSGRHAGRWQGRQGQRRDDENPRDRRRHDLRHALPAQDDLQRRHR
jgi:hypothetical protein